MILISFFRDKFLYLLRFGLLGIYSFFLGLIISLTIVFSHADFLHSVDWANFHFYNKQFFRDAVYSGNFPWWNPHIYLGRPFAADIETGVFYPPNWLFLIFPAAPAYFLVLWLHLSLGIYSMGKLCQHWGVKLIPCLIAAGAWGLSHQVIGRIQAGQLGYVCGLCLLPAAVLFTDRLITQPKVTSWLLLVIFLFLNFLAGQPHQFWVFALILTGFASLRQYAGHNLVARLVSSVRSLVLVWMAFGAAFSLAAFQLIPFLFTATQGNREASLEYATSFAMSWTDPLTAWSLNSALLPVNFENSLFIGSVIGIIGLVGFFNLKDLRIRALFITSLLGISIGLGDKTFLFGWFLEFIPGLSSLRLPGRSAVILPFALIVSAVLMTKFPFEWEKNKKLILGLTGLLLVGLIINFSLAWTGIVIGFSAVSLASLYYWKNSDNMLFSDRYILLLGVIAFFELGSGIQRSSIANLSNGAVQVEVDNWLAERVHQHEASYALRILLHPGFAPQNHGMFMGYSSPDGYCAMASMRVWTFMQTVAGLALEMRHNTFLPLSIYQQDVDVFSLTDTRYLVGVEEPQLQVQQQPSMRAWTSSAMQSVPYWQAAMDLLVAGHDGYALPLMEAASDILGPGSWVELEPVVGQVDWISYAPERLELRVDSVDHARVLVVAESWYPGWEAEVDGRMREVIPTNVWMRGVVIEAGETQVVMRYRQPGFADGLRISAVSAIGLGFLYWRGRRRGPDSRSV